MKKGFIILFFQICMFESYSQTLYVPGGSGSVGNNTTNSNVGIGTSSAPSYKLDVLGSGTGQMVSNRVLNISNSGSTFNTSDGPIYSYGSYFLSSSTRSGGSPSLTNVGIYAKAISGTENIAAMFDIGTVGRISAGTPGGSPGLMFYTGSSYDQNRFDLVNTGTYFYIGPSGGYDGLSIHRSTRNVGIGSNSPAAKLEVAGDVAINTSGVHNPSYLPGAFKLGVNGGIYSGDPTTTSGGFLNVYNSGEYSWGIVSRTTSPNTKSFIVQKVIDDGQDHEDVENLVETFLVYGDGRVFATEVTVQATPFPDYVFNKDYKLSSLHEVEEHIKQYKRLPGMPSATEVKSNGLSLGESNRLLVEKVEELTLYLIEMKKEIEVLKAHSNEE